MPKLRKFDTKVQYMKYKVLREVARLAWDGTLDQHLLDIPKTIVPGREPTMRCCVYKERAILAERVKLAMGGDPVAEDCRGCLAHRCEDVCPRGAIRFDAHQKAIINKEKCVNCGRCASVCPYSAIKNHKRPCENACKVGAISMNERRDATIDNDKCIACGACVYQCPFGALSEKSYILDVIRLLRESAETNAFRVYAAVAPSISSQFTYAKLGQVITGIKTLGFHTVVETALGADMVAFKEARELVEKGLLTSSCCPAFVRYIETAFPALLPYFRPWRRSAAPSSTATPLPRWCLSGPARQKKPSCGVPASRPMWTA